jgi:serine/threonine protein kinase
MTEALCPSCRKPVSPGAPLGLCPECLMKSGFKTGTGPASNPPEGGLYESGNPASAFAQGATADKEAGHYKSGPLGGFPPPAVEHLRPLFPQLEILELIGQGGMGAVYKARQPGLNRLVALKILPTTNASPSTRDGSLRAGADFADRFTREARLLARLHHPRIVAIHDVGIAGGLHYLVMEFVDGPNLRQVQRTGRLAPEQALRIVPEICEALQFAHDRGVVHRDIKPENVLLDREGHVKITDFGIAKMIGPDADTVALTGGVDVIGTPHYMAPEQIERPLDVDHRADIYSLGVVFYELLTGELPLGRFAAPSQRVQVDVRLDDVVLRTLEKEPARRYQQVSEVKTRIDTIANSAPPLPGTRVVQTPRGSRRKRIDVLLPILSYVPQVVLLWLVERSFWGPDPGSGFGWLALHLLALAAAYTVWGFLHYACWKALPERYRQSTTPGMATGLLFAPLFNFYWAFVSLGRLASGFEAWGDDHPDRPIKLAGGLAIAKAASFVATWTIGLLPGLATIVSIVDVILFALYYRAVVHNANEVIAAEAETPVDTIADSEQTPLRPVAQPRDAARRKPINALLPIVLYMLPALPLWMVQRALWEADVFSGPGLFGRLFGPMYIPGPMNWQAGGLMGGFGFFYLNTLALSAAYAAWAVVHHACWKALPERYRGTTPRKAVGLLFVPVFNFYWVFVSLGRLASGFEAWGKDHPERPIRHARELAMGKAAAFVASWTVGWMFGITWIVVLIDAVLFALYYRAAVHNANQVVAAEAEAQVAPVR